MIAIMSGRPYLAVRTTDCGDPPTPTHVSRWPESVLGNTSASARAARVLPLHVTGCSFSSSVKSSIFSSKSVS